jgi:type VI secretion system protein ImpL
MGVTLSPALSSGFASWVAPLSAGGVASTSSPAGAAEAQTVFQILPLSTPGILEYTIEIDGQQLRYRNTQAQWANFVWPNAQGTPGARITAVTFDGRSIEIANHPGRFGLERLINAATRTRKDSGIFEMSWSNGNNKVSVDLKIISSPQATASTSTSTNTPQSQGFKNRKLPESILGGAENTAAAAAKPEGIVQ